MKNELLFMAMDVVKETQKLINSVSVTYGMTDGEIKAYKMGVSNTLSALGCIVEADAMVIHIANTETPTEMSIDELAKE